MTPLSYDCVSVKTLIVYVPLPLKISPASIGMKENSPLFPYVFLFGYFSPPGPLITAVSNTPSSSSLVPICEQ